MVWTNVRVGGDGTAPCVPVCQEAERGSWFPGTRCSEKGDQQEGVQGASLWRRG